MSWLERIKKGLSKTSGNITSSITSIFTTKKLDDRTLEELEELLIMSDMGVKVASSLIQSLKKDKFQKDITEEEVKTYLADKIANIVSPFAKELKFTCKPQVILVCGVNGSGKTTTIGKIANKLKNEGKTVLLAACDTFRAAADLQLKVWAERAGCELIQGEPGADPASVAYKALEKATTEQIDVLLIDTAGRLQNKKNLMEELAKIIKVIKKLNPEAPHDTLLVLDACVGQNAISQVEIFKEIVNITGLIVTKLDGTAKAGILVAIAQKFSTPVHLIGVGEKIEDLDQFDAKAFSKSLFGLE
ncbi:signal recognition particle-docking protein FtsY [Candidatus Jidaibacter acanthamoebae]|nr:signal recognition particle-docking protein FtsY [Candidatus Jidaibacter acanthamoeba]